MSRTRRLSVEVDESGPEGRPPQLRIRTFADPVPTLPQAGRDKKKEVSRTRRLSVEVDKSGPEGLPPG